MSWSDRQSQGPMALLIRVGPKGLSCPWPCSAVGSPKVDSVAVGAAARRRGLTHLSTMMPLAVAASRSMLSTPVPALPTTRRFVAAAITSAVTLVSERTTSPSCFCNPNSDFLFQYCRSSEDKVSELLVDSAWEG